VGTLLHAVAHGLAASDTIMLANLTGGDGLFENTLYYVLAAGLTVDDFAVSLTDGGAAEVYTTNITAGSVVRSDTYETAADGVMDPPSALPTPGSPVLTSTTVSGVVRLFIENPTYTDGDSRVRLVETQVTHLYDAGVPVWSNALLISMVPGTTQFSIPALGLVLYTARSRVLDVYGDYSPYSAEVAITTDAGFDARSLIDGAVTTTTIMDGSITTAKLQARQITADLLAATITLTSLLKTADSGKRVEVDAFGIRLYDSTEELLVNIPTNSDPVYVKGQVNASSLISQTAATLYGTNTLPGSSVTTLQSGVSTPTNAPTVVASVDSLALTTVPSGVATAAGIGYDSTAVSYWVACDPTVSPYYVAQEFNASTGALIRSIAATGSTTTVTTTLGSTSHIADTTDATSGSTDSHMTTPLTMPRAGTITKVSVWMAGYGGSCAAKVGIWNSSGTALRMSAGFTAASETFSNGNDDNYNRSLTSGYAAASGQVIHAGFMRTSSSDGFFWSKDDGSGKTTYSGDGTADSATGYGSHDTNSKPNIYITYTYDVDTRLETAPNIAVATDGTYVYTLDTLGVVWKYDRTTMAHVAHSSVQTAITGTKSLAGMFYDATATELIITTLTGTGAGVFPKFVRVVPSTLAVSSTVYSAAAGTSYTGTTAYCRGGARLNDPLNASAATYWVPINGAVVAYTFSGTTATEVSNRTFGSAATVVSGLTHDGTVFRGWANTSTTKVWKFSAWDFTTASAVYWIGYAWYDSVGTTHETAVGPRTSITVRRRERVSVNNASIPVGGADDPDKVRVYMLPGASDFVATNAWLQVTDALTSRYLVDYTASGTHDGAGTVFPAGTPAELKSAVTGWSLKGSGQMHFGGSAFPAVVATNDIWYRTDLGMWFAYNGTRWLCTCPHTWSATMGDAILVPTIAATTNVGRSPVPYLYGAADIWIDVVTFLWQVASGGTALGASHKWNLSMTTFIEGGTAISTTPASFDITSGTLDARHRQEVAVAALLNNGAVKVAFDFGVTKTGTPGGLRVYGANIAYRYVAT
jgi:hypothetical protein